ncbi:MAG: DUF4956 domain-containing protein [Rikenellaceae bacterium]|nr:DUF4956 domain-containing protein [Rikenellaceae bacterium]
MENYPEFDPSIAAEFGEGASVATFLGTPLFQADSLLNLLIRFAFNLLVSWIIVQFFYYKKSRRRDYYVTFMLFSAVMFLLIFLMENVKLGIGLTLGLFAIFGVIRYRTETVPIREMTYLFVIIGTSVINGLALNIPYTDLVVGNVLLLLLMGLLENQSLLKHQTSKLVLYDKIELITPERQGEMIADLEQRLGFKIDKAEVGHVDFLRDVAFVKVYYHLGKGETNTINHITKVNQYNG